MYAKTLLDDHLAASTAFTGEPLIIVIVDLGMRMLTPRELYNAQGFPPDYEIEHGLDGTVFPTSVQVSWVGNSVSPPVAAALVSANCDHLVRHLGAGNEL